MWIFDDMHDERRVYRHESAAVFYLYRCIFWLCMAENMEAASHRLRAEVCTNAVLCGLCFDTPLSGGSVHDRRMVVFLAEAER